MYEPIPTRRPKHLPYQLPWRLPRIWTPERAPRPFDSHRNPDKADRRWNRTFFFFSRPGTNRTTRLRMDYSPWKRHLSSRSWIDRRPMKTGFRIGNRKVSLRRWSSFWTRLVVSRIFLGTGSRRLVVRYVPMMVSSCRLLNIRESLSILSGRRRGIFRGLALDVVVSLRCPSSSNGCSLRYGAPGIN